MIPLEPTNGSIFDSSIFYGTETPAFRPGEEVPPPFAYKCHQHQRHAWNSNPAWAETGRRGSQSARYCRPGDGLWSRMFRGPPRAAADMAQCADEVTCRLWRAVRYTQAAAGRAESRTAERQSGPDAGGARSRVHGSILSWSASHVASFLQAPDFSHI